MDNDTQEKIEIALKSAPKEKLKEIIKEIINNDGCNSDELKVILFTKLAGYLKTSEELNLNEISDLSARIDEIENGDLTLWNAYNDWGDNDGFTNEEPFVRLANDILIILYKCKSKKELEAAAQLIKKANDVPIMVRDRYVTNYIEYCERDLLDFGDYSKRMIIPFILFKNSEFKEYQIMIKYLNDEKDLDEIKSLIGDNSFEESLFEYVSKLIEKPKIYRYLLKRKKDTDFIIDTVFKSSGDNFVLYFDLLERKDLKEKDKVKIEDYLLSIRGSLIPYENRNNFYSFYLNLAKENRFRKQEKLDIYMKLIKNTLSHNKSDLNVVKGICLLDYEDKVYLKKVIDELENDYEIKWILNLLLFKETSFLKDISINNELLIVLTLISLKSNRISLPEKEYLMSEQNSSLHYSWLNEYLSNFEFDNEELTLIKRKIDDYYNSFVTNNLESKKARCYCYAIPYLVCLQIINRYAALTDFNYIKYYMNKYDNRPRFIYEIYSAKDTILKEYKLDILSI